MLLRFLLIFHCFLCFLIGVKSRGHSQALKLSSYKVVIPQLVHERWRRDANHSGASNEELKYERLTYSLSIEDKDHFLHLRKNRDFLAKTFVQYSHDANGNLVTSYPKVPGHCHYHGHVEGREDSLVALSTCSGLRGVIIIGNQTYGLEPAARSTINEHLLFQLKDSQYEPFVCGVTNEISRSNHHTSHDPALSMTKLFRKKRNLPQTRYVELVLVVDKQRFDYKKGNVTAVREEMVDLANLLNGYYKQLNIHVILVGLEIFQTENPFNVDGSAGDVLGNFVKWRKKDLIPRIRHDVGQLIVGRSSAYPGGILGMAFVGTVCSVASGGGINVFNGDTLQYFSTVVAHEMGHNLGMNHDDNRCTCDGGSCIMSASASGSTLFSTCSGDDFETLVLRGGGICLKNQPSPSDVVTVAECGNGVLEEGEQCDCGKPEECKDKCCDAATCKFTPGSSCAQGACCKDCKIKVAGTPCRGSVNVCDLPEYCNGQSGFCPGDFYIMDGKPCASNTAYCYEGRCQTYDFQCQQLFGRGAKKADDICFRDINSRGDRFGNCGVQGSNYVKCTLANSLCGKVQCTDVDANYPPKGAVITVQDIGGVRCVNADFDLGTDVLDPAYVNTGSGCATGKTCVDFQCINASALEQNLNCNAQETCNGNGVCNDQGHCHCDNGWGPPNCDRAGRGGSVDSGPAQIDHSLRDGLLIFFLLVVPILILVAVVLLYMFRRDWVNNFLKTCRSRSRNATSTQANGATQRSAVPQSQAQNRSRTPQPPPSYPGVTSGLPPSYEEINYGNMQDDIPETYKPAPQQGPGVPKPIPAKQALSVPTP
ncbi:disintegrin and metalloproteinase domain-containing protein 9 [Megalops cyprinoides]|uniref:disintegrin and metalloproteinase domain-containing protein 9 n=1 Tax=Megalops cyprinoides TaxID=118141 RepID=UPI0018655762|nr:disintegrin and metalloproteinase domain-containing protein 9 [Megalops cyprinoides]